MKHKMINNLLKISAGFMFIVMSIDSIVTYILMSHGVPEANPIIAFLYRYNLIFIYPIIALLLFIAIYKTTNGRNFFKIKFMVFSVVFAASILSVFMEITNIGLLMDVI